MHQTELQRSAISQLCVHNHEADTVLHLREQSSNPGTEGLSQPASFLNIKCVNGARHYYISPNAQCPPMKGRKCFTGPLDGFELCDLNLYYYFLHIATEKINIG